MADDKGKRSLENLKNSVWPDVATDKGRKNATLGGAIAAGWIVLSYAFVLGSVFVTGETPFGPSEDPDEALGLVMITALFGLVMIVLFSFFGWRIWKRQGHVSAIITLVWTVVEVAMKLGGDGDWRMEDEPSATEPQHRHPNRDRNQAGLPTELVLDTPEIPVVLD